MHPRSKNYVILIITGLKALEQINDDVLRYLCTFYRNTSDNNRFEVRSSLYLIKQLLTQSLEEFK